MNQAPPRRSFLVAAAVAAVLMLAGCGDSAAPPPAAPPAPTFAAAGAVTCGEEAYTATLNPRTGWSHPQQNFYAPGENAPSEGDLGHLLINDSAAVVRYRRDATESDRAALRDWAGTKASIVVLPARSREAPQVEAFTVNRQLICDGVDTAQLTVFADRRGNLTVSPHDDSG